MSEEITYEEAVEIRKKQILLEKHLSRLILEQYKTGKSGSVIARELQLTESYIYQLIRKEKAKD